MTGRSERILLVGDVRRHVQTALSVALPTSSVLSVGDYFEAIAELSAAPFTAVLASAEPIERRPEPAVQTLRQLAGDSRFVLFGQPSLEGLSRKMLDFGVDDYLITPAEPGEIQEIFGQPLERPVAPIQVPSETPSVSPSLLRGLSLAEIVLDALIQHPAEAPQAAVQQINELLAPALQVYWQAVDKPPIEVNGGQVVLTHAVRAGNDLVGHLHLALCPDEDGATARHFLAQLALLIGRIGTLQERNNRLQKLAITDQLTGAYNRRYFEHFLARIIERARVMRLSVTLILFDIDDFKKYNDTYGHGVGDQILRETAAMMKRCCREHDLVARIGGDEFAVVFWEKEGPRLPREQEPGKPPLPSKPPETPRQIFERFARLMATQEFPGLGPSGRGTLTISGGLASFPWEGRDPAELVAAADNALVQGAKRGGKNRLFLVGENDSHTAP